MTVRIAVVQTSPRLGDVPGNAAETLALMESERAEVYVLPELALTGYNFSSAEQVEALSEPASSGPTFEALAGFAKRRRAWVAYGFAERDGGKRFNSANLVGPDGLVGTYRKVHLFDREKLFFAPGDRGFAVHDLPFGKVGLMVCFDWFFPESMRTLAARGAQLVLHPSNLVLPHCPQAMITRCLENRVFAATANRVGTEPGGEKPLTYIGTSQIVSPRGELLARLGAAGTGAAAADCDLAEALAKSINSRNDLFADRRPEFYVR